MLFRLPTLRLTASLLSLAAASACSSSSKNNPTPAVTTPVGVTWTVDGTNITADSKRQTTMGANIEVIGAYTTTAGNVVVSKGVDLTFPKAVGTYSVVTPGTGATGVQAVYVVVAGATSGAYLGSTGTVTVTSLTSTNIIGTFSFTGTDVTATTGTKTISNGAFNLPL